jgi:hypothetical protein
MPNRGREGEYCKINCLGMEKGKSGKWEMQCKLKRPNKFLGLKIITQLTLVFA